MSKRCPACHSRNTVMNLPGEAQTFEKYEGQFIEPVDVPYKCLDCGYVWTQTLRGAESGMDTGC